jgi:hypothetical protein
MNNKMKPALIGGVVTGILSLIPIVSSCCCLWAIGGGLLASYLYSKDSPTAVPPGEGAIMGAMSGGVASVIYLIIGLPLVFLLGMANMEEMYRRAGVELPVAGVALALLSVIFMIIGLLIFSTLGGLLGAVILGKQKGGPAGPPPPPQDLNAGPSSGFGTGV